MFVPHEADPHYEEDSWTAWRAVQAKLAAGGPGLTAEDRTYQPSPDEIASRINDMRWMIAEGFNPREICTVMEKEMPPLARLRLVLAAEGFQTARAFVRQWRVTTDYDGEHPDERTEVYKRRSDSHLLRHKTGGGEGCG